jgi:quercetin dioxygenase-like cupin family protein
LEGVFSKRDHEFESAFLQRGVRCEPDFRDFRARLYTLAPGEVIPWHYHTAVTDWYFCLVGILRVETRAPRGDERLAAGAHHPSHSSAIA